MNLPFPAVTSDYTGITLYGQLSFSWKLIVEIAHIPSRVTEPRVPRLASGKKYFAVTAGKRWPFAFLSKESQLNIKMEVGHSS